MSDSEKPARSTGGAWVFRGVTLRALLPYAGMGVLLAVAIVVLGDEIGHHIRAIEAWISSLGPWGVLAFVGLFVLATTVLVPETLLAVMAGALFGLEAGLAAVVAGGLAAASLQYFLSRRILRTRIQKTLAAKPRFAAIQRAVARSEFRVQLLLRLTPLNPATLSFLLGAAGVRFSGFVLACIALLPTQLMEVYFGYAGRHVAKIAGRSAKAVYLHDIMVIGGLVACIVVMVFVSRLARNAVAETVAADGLAEPTGDTP